MALPGGARCWPVIGGPGRAAWIAGPIAEARGPSDLARWGRRPERVSSRPGERPVGWRAEPKGGG